ncbi:putative adenylylsulfate reductase, alpha subunit [Fibrobacter succinogenes subsp. succinogenes S85]|uniref:Fumarate reductase/succinate dehydrogenase flavoprotein domain protein n=1 Tax=Fibrobacter succinogenes (strain ATCC 19169 / S85) TaxID=59374 RepID=C9RJP5_FIBSS|nr:adenylyl-sulfate reductase subunit alpha [Fibrobacter succinogenes]ACX73758.1 fumarate reductase/succinate dehydrogenase flavoprotein domain protein [Fibrobacter succinogenes subsp. succinogenes S85]ADL26758.1 putative adenylylsulfate reductase, alpha subunit [Fibrobacter succinogenes subsp. succinogenes S85]
MNIEKIKTDLLIIGGGTAGCYAAITASTLGAAKDVADIKILVVEKANIKRSGCLAAGVNALNAYITEGRTPKDYVEYAKKDADGIVREDLLYSISEKFNEVTAHLEKLGLVILKDKDGKYVTRGNRNIKINGENIKPILAAAVAKAPNVQVLNHVNIFDFSVHDNRIDGAFGFGIENDTFYAIEARAVIIATGGAAGLYRPNNPGFSRHKMWYPPFNTGAGYAMGIRHGAEMTTFEMRFIALRCKDTIAPTGTLAQGVGAKQINSLGEVYETKYGISTSERVYGTVAENLEGRGPCYLRTVGITPAQEDSLLKAYLNMAPSQTIRWLENETPSKANVEIEGTEPYIVGGHTASGYWVDTKRATTIDGLYAAGDVAGGAPQKYVTGALAEGEIAAKSAVEYINAVDCRTPLQGVRNDVDADPREDVDAKATIKEAEIARHVAEIETYLSQKNSLYTTEQLEEAMQIAMDEYAGGIKTGYGYSEKHLNIAKEKIDEIESLTDKLSAADLQEVMYIYELKERLTVCKSVIAHLKARHETRWHSFAENLDYPEKDNANFRKYVNSRLENGEIKIILRDLTAEGQKNYEHQH